MGSALVMMSAQKRYGKYKYAFDQHDDATIDAVWQRAEMIIGQFVAEENIDGKLGYQLNAEVFECAERLVHLYMRRLRSDDSKFDEALTLIRSAGYTIAEYEILERKKKVEDFESLQELMTRTMEELASGMSIVQRIGKEKGRSHGL